METVTRIPRIQALPLITAGLWVIRVKCIAKFSTVPLVMGAPLLATKGQSGKSKRRWRRIFEFRVHHKFPECRQWSIQDRRIVRDQSQDILLSFERKLLEIFFNHRILLLQGRTFETVVDHSNSNRGAVEPIGIDLLKVLPEIVLNLTSLLCAFRFPNLSCDRHHVICPSTQRFNQPTNTSARWLTAPRVSR